MRAELKLVSPRPGRTANYRMRGTHLGHYTDRSTGTGNRATAKAVLDARKAEILAAIKRGGDDAEVEPTFAAAATAYMQNEGERRFMAPILLKIGDVPRSKVDQALVDRIARELYPDATPATRNRQVYTPVLAVLAKAKVPVVIDRPRGGNGTARQDWLTKEQVEALVGAAWETSPRFGALLTFLFYTGCRLSEALKLQVSDLRIEAGMQPLAIIGKTKNGRPRGVLLAPVAMRAIRLALAQPGNATWTKQVLPRTTGSVFHFTKSGALYDLLTRVEERAGVIIPDGVSFHITRHTFGAWCRRYGQLDRAGMVATGAWASTQGAASYDHIEVSTAAMAVLKFPGASDGVPVLKEVG